ncbi:MAK10-like protein [Tanacetum coccineum]
MTNKIDTVLKAITDRLAGSLPSDTVKNPKLSISPVLSARSYPTIDPQCSSHPSTSINAIKTRSTEASTSHTSQLEIVLAHAPIYNAILDKYVESLELGKNGSAFVQGEVYAKMEDPGLLTLPCRLGDSKPFDTLADLGLCVNIIPLYLFKNLHIGLLEETDHIFGLADGTKSYPVGIVKEVEVHIGKLKLLNDFYVIDMKKDPKTPLLVGRGFLATANAVIDCRKAKITVGEGITRSVFGVKGVDLGEEEAPYWTKLRKRESYKPRPSSDGEIARDVEINPYKDVLVFRRMNKLPKNGDVAWHAKIRLIDPDGEEFTKTLSPPLESSPSRKAHLLEEKQIPSVGVFDEVFLALEWLLEEIHMTWAHLEKKRTRLRTYTKSLEDLCIQWLETASLFPMKLKLRWYGPFSVSKDMKNGAIELYDEDGNKFIVNKQRVKPNQKDVLDADRNDDITLEDEEEVT